MWDLLIIGIFVILLLLPMLPALREFHKKSDAAPLAINQAYTDDAGYFAQQFLKYEKLQTSLAYVSDDYVIMELGKLAEPSTPDVLATKNDKIIVGEENLVLPDGVTFEREIFSKRNIYGGLGNMYYSLLAGKCLSIGPNSEVLRWAHAAQLYIDSHAHLKGRVSATNEMIVNSTVKFLELHSPVIRFINKRLIEYDNSLSGKKETVGKENLSEF